MVETAAWLIVTNLDLVSAPLLLLSVRECVHGFEYTFLAELKPLG